MTADRFESLAALQEAHMDLVRSVGRDILLKNNPLLIGQFVDRAIATGAVLDQKEDRAAAQSLIGFWTARLTTAVREAGREVTREATQKAKDAASSKEAADNLQLTTTRSHGAFPKNDHADVSTVVVSSNDDGQKAVKVPTFDDTLLAEFDTATLDVTAAANRVYNALPPDQQRLARRLFVRLVRMVPDDAADSGSDTTPMPRSDTTRVVGLPDFEAVPVARGALRDRGDPAKVDAVLKTFADAGVLRIVPGGSRGADQVQLRFAPLMKDWSLLKGWLDERRRFRHRAMLWQMAKSQQTAYSWSRARTLDALNFMATRTDSIRQFVVGWLPRLALIPDRGGELLSPAEIEEARCYFDRSEVEREFVHASRFDAERSQERNRLLMGLFGIAAIAAGIGWGFTVWFFFQARAEAASARNSATVAGMAQQLAHERARLSGLRLFIRGWADVAAAKSLEPAARSDAELIVAQTRWNSLKDQSTLVNTLQPNSLNAVTASVRRSPPTEPKELRELLKGDERNFITDVYEIRDALLNTPATLSALLEARNTAFVMAGFSALHITEGIENSKPIADVGPHVREFWRQHWGEMLLVEGKTVETAMFRFSDVLNDVWPEYKRRYREQEKLHGTVPETAKLVDEAKLKELRQACRALDAALKTETLDQDFSYLRNR